MGAKRKISVAERLQKAIVAAYDLDSMAQMVKFRLDRRLDNTTTTGARLDRVVFELVQWAEQNQQIPQLTRAALEYLQDNGGASNELAKLVEEQESASVGSPHSPTPTPPSSPVPTGLSPEGQAGAVSGGPGRESHNSSTAAESQLCYRPDEELAPPLPPTNSALFVRRPGLVPGGAHFPAATAGDPASDCAARSEYELPRYQATFLHSIVTSREFADIGLVFNPYSEFLDRTEESDLERVVVYLCVPEPSYFSKVHLEDTCIVAVCDAGRLEIEKKVAGIDMGFLHNCYEYSPSRLNGEKKLQLMTVIGNVLRGTFVLAAVMPKLLLGAGLANPGISYEAILNTVVFPLVMAHSQIGFRRFRLVVSDVQKYFRIPMTSRGRHIIKAGYQDGRFEVSAIQRDSLEFFYIYAARHISYAVGRYYKSKDERWLLQLGTAFKH